MRSGSPATCRPAGASIEKTTSSGACRRASRAAVSRTSRTANGRMSNGWSPDSRRERSSSWLTRRPRRRVWSSIVRSVSGSGSETPSTTFSSTACSAPIGVRSSCETFATRSRRRRSVSASSAVMRLNARASSPTSSLEVTATWRPCSPRAIALATAAISRSGFVVPRASTWTQASAMRIPASVATSAGRCSSRTPRIVVTAVIQTAATMTIPSLSFSEESACRNFMTATAATRRRSRRSARCARRRCRACAARRRHASRRCARRPIRRRSPRRPRGAARG